MITSNNQYFVITIDTEADNAWSSPKKIEMNNFKEIPRFQELCEKYNIIPTYLLTYEYTTYKPAIEYLKPKVKDGKCEIGHHLHVWTTPPFQNEKSGIDLDWLHAYQFELPDNLFEQKANSLHDAIVYAFGKQPIIHRAGRWGVDDRTIDWLSKKKYLIDTSVIPYHDMSSIIGKISKGQNFFKFDQKPFIWKTNETSSIIELPVTVDYKNRPLKNITNILQRVAPKNNLVRKAIKKVHQPKMFRPNPLYNSSFYEKIIQKAKSNNSLINMMLHSSELAYKCSPFTQTRIDYERFWKILENAFMQIERENFMSLLPEVLFNYISVNASKKSVVL